MLPQLHAERQLLAIEAASVPHMKPEDRSGVLRRYRNQLQHETGEKKPAAAALLEAFQQAGFPIVHESVTKK